MVTYVHALVTLLYQTLMRTLCKTPSKPRAQISIVCVSDTHSKTLALPQGDILIHAGDLSHGGSLAEIQDTIDWLKVQPFKETIAICGNGDLFFEKKVRL